MTTQRFSLPESSADQFLSAANVELNRAERYRVFISLTIFDLGFLSDAQEQGHKTILAKIGQAVRDKIRACDYVAVLDGNRLAVLFPETPRQGAEIASRRLTAIIKAELKSSLGQSPSEVIPVEMASYPDTAGAKALTEFLKELANSRLN